MKRQHAIPIPARMAKLDRDPRGYPIFYMAYRDAHGRAHFTINDDILRARAIDEDRCSICGDKLLRGRWFIGGPRSAFHSHGSYIDPPMHDECAHYALRVCPYLAVAGYDGLIGGATLASDDTTAIVTDRNTLPDRPDIFVAVLARGQTIKRANLLATYIRPARPYIRVEFWRDGEQLDMAEGAEIAKRILAEPIRR